MEMNMDVRGTQTRLRTWVESRLGVKAMDPHERAMRFLEEALELAQVLNVTKDETNKLAAHVFSKDTGQLKQEIGGVGTTLLGLCESVNVSFSDATERELHRIEKLPLHKFQKRQNENAAAGIGAPVEL